MENNKLQNLIKKGETETVAFVEDLNISSISSILTSFLNHQGGNLLIGIRSNKHIVGVNENFNVENLRSQLTYEITPEAPIEIIEEKIEDKSILIMKVSEGTKQPYVCGDSIYIRKYDKTLIADTKDIASLIKNRQKDELHWERQVTFGVDLEDLDEKLIDRVMETAQKNGRSTYKGKETLGFLSHYGLFNNGSFTNACVILFAKNTNKYFPQARARITEYQKDKTDKALLRDDIVEGNLFQIRESLENYVSSMGTRSTFSENEWRRMDFKYPDKGLQEGIINALIHRDYSRFNSHLTISVYPGSFVIANSGHLPNELKVRDLKRNHRSFPSNPDIAHIIFLMGYIDKLGRGTIKIIEECKAFGLKEPKWTSSDNEVVLKFYGPAEDMLKNINIESYEDINIAINKIFKDEIDSSILEKLKSILILILLNHNASSSIISDKLDIPKTSLKRYLSLLKKHRLIEQSGAGKNTSYSIGNLLF